MLQQSERPAAASSPCEGAVGSRSSVFCVPLCVARGDLCVSGVPRGAATRREREGKLCHCGWDLI